AVALRKGSTSLRRCRPRPPRRSSKPTARSARERSRRRVKALGSERAAEGWPRDAGCPSVLREAKLYRAARSPDPKQRSTAAYRSLNLVLVRGALDACAGDSDISRPALCING